MTAHQRRCTEAVLEKTPDAAIVANLGSAAWTLAEIEDRDRNFYLAGAMGGTTPIGLGIAMGVDDQVTVLDGDGSMLMSLGALATVSTVDPSNLVIVVWENAVYETTGGQELLTATNFVGVARENGLEAERVDTLEDFEAAYANAVDHDGAAVVVAEVDPYTPDEKNIDYAHSHVKHRFRQSLVGD
ncbi:MAG: thiamine pyrophosphate-dependent enzyme [Halanaeroarchaeum sp.]